MEYVKASKVSGPIAGVAEENLFIQRTLRKDLCSGAIAGQISGLIMAAVMMLVFTIFLGRGPLYPVQVIGSFIFGDAALSGFHAPAFIAGLLLHQLGPSLFWGIAFGALVSVIRPRAGLPLFALALVVGLASQAIDVHLLLAFAFPALHGHNIWAEQVPAFWSWAAHAVFGLGLLTFPKIRRRCAE